MDIGYWNEKAESYEDEIFNVWCRDRDGVLKRFFRQKKFCNKNVIDCGCGIGHGLKTLSKHFRSVLAVDISKQCLSVAQGRYASLTNIKFQKVDLSQDRLNLPKMDVAVSVNSIITPNLKTRLKMLKNIRKHLKPNGQLALVIPSLESYYYVAYKLTEWNLREGGRVTVSRFQQRPFREGHGVLPIDGVLTKHYLKEELISLLQLIGFEVQEIKKVCYDWDTEYEDPPRWMKAPYPWDWFCVARKK